MERVGLLRAAGVRVLAATAVAACVGGVWGASLRAQAAQTPPAQQPAAPPPPPDLLKFTADSPVLLINTVKADKTAEFEAAWASIRAAFAKAEAAELKSFGQTLAKLYKIDTGGAAAPAPAALYILQLDTPSKTLSYDPVKIVYETLVNGKVITREEGDAIYAKLKDSVQNINFWVLIKVG